jgi:hypothetical protein
MVFLEAWEWIQDFVPAGLHCNTGKSNKPVANILIDRNPLLSYIRYASVAVILD